MPRPRVTRILESSLYVEDLARAVRFYDDLFAFPTLFRDDRICAYDVCGMSVLLLFQRGASAGGVELAGGERVPGHDASGQIHLALSINADQWDYWQQALARRSIPIEKEQQWPRGGRSIYFRDPDGHLLELVTPGCWATY